MVENLIQQGGQTQNKTVNLDLGNLDQFNQGFMGAGNEEKIHLEDLTESTVTSIELQMSDEIHFNQRDVSKRFYKCTLKVTNVFSYTNENGETEEVTSTTNYGGLRYYFVQNEIGEPVLDQNGNPILKYYWSGDAKTAKMPSYFSKLLALAQDFDKSITNYKKFFEFLQSEPKCLIRSEYTSFANSPKKTHKHIIQKFLP